MTEEEKKLEEQRKKEANKKKLLFALAVLMLGTITDEEMKDIEKWEDLDEESQKQAIKEYKIHERILKPLEKIDGLNQPKIQEAMKKVGEVREAKVYVIANPGDGKTCDKCRQWIGVKVSDVDPNYPSIDDWMRSGALHPHCRCSLHEVEEMDVVDARAKDYLERKQARLDQLAAYNAFNTSPSQTLVFN